METECVYCAVRVEYLSISQGYVRATIKYEKRTRMCVCIMRAVFFYPFAVSELGT